MNEMEVFQKITLIYSYKHKSIFCISKRVNNIKNSDNILHKNLLTIVYDFLILL